ncbi:hypothetical protein ADEAN_000241300 [Angomonas deanei]|uniref:Uncharacterized protein n=1 Tax=Angomonas deanei TaxID=59799 RepID=A0A7G2C5G3_9TRYP|nr:hypothetical protein ADEAN_000241300 [Angomonas deanei]
MKQPVYYVSALFDADKGLFDFREEGDFAVLVRDAKRRIEVQLTRVKNHLFPHSTASGVVPEYTLVVEPWEERDFFMSLNGIPYYQGPVVLESKDILSLCLHGSQQDDMPFEILSAEDYMEKQMQASWRDAEANRITQEQLDEARLAQLERKQRMLKAQERINEMIKWQNFYHYRYTISGDSSHSLDKETRDGILFHHDRRGREGVPRQMIVSHITVPDDLVLAAVSGKLSDPPNASMTGGPLTTKRPPVNDRVIEELRKRAFLTLSRRR